MPAIIWLGENLHWISPLAALIYSEILGWKSGAQASISQKILAFIMRVIDILKAPPTLPK